MACLRSEPRLMLFKDCPFSRPNSSEFCPDEVHFLWHQHQGLALHWITLFLAMRRTWRGSVGQSSTGVSVNRKYWHLIPQDIHTGQPAWCVLTVPGWNTREWTTLAQRQSSRHASNPARNTISFSENLLATCTRLM